MIFGETVLDRDQKGQGINSGMKQALWRDKNSLDGFSALMEEEKDER